MKRKKRKKPDAKLVPPKPFWSGWETVGMAVGFYVAEAFAPLVLKRLFGKRGT